jgi:hypothetical protein
MGLGQTDTDMTLRLEPSGQEGCTPARVRAYHTVMR